MMSMMKPSISETYMIDEPVGLLLERQAYIDMFYFMKLNRLLEEKLHILYKQNRIVGGLYSSLGQEATSIGSAYALQSGDYLAPMIRNLGSLLVRGIEPLEVFLQYLGRRTGPTKGKEATLHFGSLEKGLIAPVSLLGDLIPVMAGIALILKVKGEQNIALTYTGDGGSSTGAFHEGLNFAAVKRLPMILILENNLYAYSTPVAKQANIRDLVEKAKAYGIYGEIVDGNNVLHVYEATRRARERCIKGEGPVLIESKTFRRMGHAAHDDASYVPEETRSKWERKDPLEAYTRFLTRKKIADEEKLKRISSQITSSVEHAAEEALAAPHPEPEVALENVYFAAPI